MEAGKSEIRISARATSRGRTRLCELQIASVGGTSGLGVRTANHCGNGGVGWSARGGCVGKLEWTRAEINRGWWAGLPLVAAGAFDATATSPGSAILGWDRSHGTGMRRRQSENGVFRGVGGYQ